MSNTYEHLTWKRMRKRCSNPNATQFQDYGGRGIKVCERWKKFENFLADMGTRPGIGYSIDRIDVNGNYCPENCRWATAKEQANNTRRNRILVAFGKEMTLKQWAETTGLPDYCIRLRIDRYNWSIEQALSTPRRPTTSKTGSTSTMNNFHPELAAEFATAVESGDILMAAYKFGLLVNDAQWQGCSQEQCECCENCDCNSISYNNSKEVASVLKSILFDLQSAPLAMSYGYHIPRFFCIGDKFVAQSQPSEVSDGEVSSEPVE
jgi:hypothetical protein